MQALIAFLIRNLLALWPVARVYTWEQGLRLRGGHARNELAPGLHVRVPFLDEVRKWPTQEIALDLETAAVTTTDGCPLAISANLSYRMTSVRELYLGLYNVERSLSRLALGHIATACAQLARGQILEDRPGLEARIARELSDRLGDKGIVVVRVHLTDLVIVKPHRHYMDGAVASS